MFNVSFNTFITEVCEDTDTEGNCGGNPGYPLSWCFNENTPWVLPVCQAFCGVCGKKQIKQVNTNITINKVFAKLNLNYFVILYHSITSYN